MRSFGQRVRRMREFLHLSQEVLARRAGLSQTSVSRLEAGRAPHTPLVIAMRVHGALADELRALDPGLLTDESRRWLEAQTLFDGVGHPSFAVLHDAGLERLIRTYGSLQHDERQILLAVLDVLASMRSDLPLAGDPAAVHAVSNPR